MAVRPGRAFELVALPAGLRVAPRVFPVAAFAFADLLRHAVGLLRVAAAAGGRKPGQPRIVVREPARLRGGGRELRDVGDLEDEVPQAHEQHQPRVAHARRRRP